MTSDGSHLEEAEHYEGLLADRERYIVTLEEQIRSYVEPLLNARQVAAILGSHPDFVLQLARRGEIPSLKLGHRTVRFRLDDVEAWIESHVSRGIGDR